VAIIAMFKDNHITGRMRLLVESESLLNDGVAAVLFVMAAAFAESGGAGQGAAGTLLTLAKIVFGGAGAGALCGGAAILISQRTSEYLIEAALSTVAAFGSFLIAEYFHVSGVLATVVAGLMMGNLGVLREDSRSYLSRRGREFVHGLWEFAAFLANSIVFLLIGVDVANAHLENYGAGKLVAVVVIALAARALTVYPLCALFHVSRWRVSLPEQHVLWWGGLRGALALALALSLPPAMPFRDEIMVATFGVVGFSIVVQGLTTPLLLRRLGLVRGADETPLNAER
ncbi:MAG: cation:proton antiporter, partial [Methylocystis sp.]|nr:cation:proton antiporter [Methylocystis sp.]